MDWLRPDAKSQVTIKYDGVPVAIDTIVLSTQHAPEVEPKMLEEYVIEEVVKPCLPKHLSTENITYLVNPTGRFVVGGPQGDCGLTGRKIIVDTYGGAAPHGGGAFSGKDPSKVDRSAAYAARCRKKYSARRFVREMFSPTKLCNRSGKSHFHTRFHYGNWSSVGFVN